jgi:transposase-like protein
MRRTYTPEFHEQAVRAVLDGPRPIADVARELDMDAGTLHGWVTRYRRGHTNGAATDAPAERGTDALARENRALRIALRVLL